MAPRVWERDSKELMLTWYFARFASERDGPAASWTDRGLYALSSMLYALRSTVYELVLKLSSFSFSLVCILTLVLYNTSSSYELCIRLELEYELVVHLRADLSSDYPEIFLTILQDRRTYISYHIRRKE